MLKAEATDMKTLPVDFDFDFADNAKKVFDSVGDREPMSVAEESYTEDHLLIDDMIADYFGFMDMRERIRDALIEKVDFRTNRVRRTSV